MHNDRRIPRQLALLLPSVLAACTSPRVEPARPERPAVARIAAAQYPIEGDRSFDQIRDKVVAHVAEAASAGASLIVFPELVALDAWPTTPAPADEAAAARRLAREITPPLIAAVRRLADEHGVAIVVGAPREVGGAVRNSAVLAFPDGRSVVQDKLFLTPWEREVGWEAGDRLVVFETPWGRTAILICYDCEVPMLSDRLAEHAVEVLLVPSMTESEHGLLRVRWTAQARAVGALARGA